MNSAILHHYRQARQHQLATYGRGALHIQLPDGAWWPAEHTGGGAAAGFHALAAFLSAKRTIHFHADLAETVKRNNKRSRAAKRGWKTRRANQ